MNKSLLLASLVAAVALAACGKKEEAAPAPAAVVAPVAAVAASGAEMAASGAAMAASGAAAAAKAAASVPAKTK